MSAVHFHSCFIYILFFLFLLHETFVLLKRKVVNVMHKIYHTW
jgi:hypothetical protein